MHDAIWRDPPVGDLAWSGVETDTTAASRWPAILAVLSSFLFVVFIGGGVLVGALSLYALSYRQATTGTVVPEPMVRVLETVTGGPSGTVPSADGSRQRMSIFDALPDWEGTEPFHILLLGIDQRDDERDQGVPPRSDTLILARIDPRTKSAGLISFPRDLWVDIPGFGQGRLNTAYTLGELRKVEGGGPGLAKRTMERNFGLKVDYFGRVDFRGFEQIVDTLGGIVVDVERPIKDDEYPTENYGVERLYVPAGLQYMDGHLALRYARSRHSDNDFGRMRRQQRVMFAVRQRALHLNMLARAPTLAGQARDMVATDLSLPQLVRLAKLAQQIDSERVASLVIDASYVYEAGPSVGAYVLLPDKERIRRAILNLVAGMNPQQPARLEVLNGSGRVGLAADTAKFLLNLGYEVVRIDDADRQDYSESVLEVYGGRRSLADDLAATLRLPRWTAREGRRAEDDVDVRLIVGREFRLPQPDPTRTVGALPTEAAPPSTR